MVTQGQGELNEVEIGHVLRWQPEDEVLGSGMHKSPVGRFFRSALQVKVYAWFAFHPMSFVYAVHSIETGTVGFASQQLAPPSESRPGTISTKCL